MKGQDVTFIEFLSSESQFYVPVYQRKYSWEAGQCEKLFNDVIEVANDAKRPCHFIGSIIYLAKEETQHASALKEYLIIDGQQRLTTLSLLLLALGDYTQEYHLESEQKLQSSPTSLEQIKEGYLINKWEKGDLFYKIKLNSDDFFAYKKILESRTKTDEIKALKIFENYQYFLDKMKRSKTNPQSIFNGIKKLKMVDICLFPADNPQLVFETVNSTGLPLSTSDKIRNFILMMAPMDKQDKLYIELWSPMEYDLGLIEKGNRHFENFFRYYMTLVLEKRIRPEYYENFKNYFFTKQTKGVECIVQDIRMFSKYYLRWLNAGRHCNGIDLALFKIKDIGQGNIVPAVLKILADIDANLVSQTDAILVLNIIESYWMRRALCQMPTNTADPVCISILKSLGNKEGYVKSFIQVIINDFTHAQRMPTDDDMMRALRTLNIYNTSRCRKVLDLLEAHENKEYIKNSSFSIEHIMPQTINDPATCEKEDWVLDLGSDWKRIHNTYLHTIGNLTLTGFNEKYRNYRFLEKRNMQDGYSRTPIRISSSIAKQEKWGEVEILARCDEMTKIIIDMWKYPKLL